MSHGESREVGRSLWRPFLRREFERIPLDQDVRVADHVLAGGAEMNDARRPRGRDLRRCERVPSRRGEESRFVPRRGLEIDVVQRGSQAIDLGGTRSGSPRSPVGIPRAPARFDANIRTFDAAEKTTPHVDGGVSSLQWGPISPVERPDTVMIVSGLRLVHSFNWRRWN